MASTAVFEKPQAKYVHGDDGAPLGEEVPGITRPMTYEEYITSPEEMARYDIIDGYKVYYTWGQEKLANPTRLHQEIQGNIYEAFRAWQRATKAGRTIQAPCDVRITYQPNRVRQPDILVISNERLAANPPITDPTPLSPAPELVVEIVSPSDTKAVLSAKLADYCTVDVRECWVAASGAKTVEVLRLARDGTVTTVATYAEGDTAHSEVFPGLSVPVSAVFEE